MAKGSFLGVKRGKLGDAVGYNVTNSNDKDKQGWRVYQPVVSNPQTDGQIDQRIKLAAVNNLYRALKPIIQRGWENHKYGDESRRAFLKKALGASFNGPYIEKGSTLAVPIEGVPITYGSLPPVVVDCPGSAVMPIFANVILSPTADIDTIGQVSQTFIDNGVALEGDQITIVFGYVGDYSSAVIYREFSFYVNTGDTSLPLDTLGISFKDVIIEDEPRLAIDVIAGDYSAYNYCCMCSVSRNGDTANLRSYAEFAMTASFRAMFYGNAQQDAAAKRSYRKQQSSDTNWPLVPGGGGSQTVQSAFTRAGTEFTPVSIARKNVGGQNYEVIVDDGGVQYYIGSRPSAASSEIVYLSGTGSTVGTDPSDLTTANSVNVFDANNVSAGLRAWLISKGVDAAVLPV